MPKVESVLLTVTEDDGSVRVAEPQTVAIVWEENNEIYRVVRIREGPAIVHYSMAQMFALMAAELLNELNKPDGGQDDSSDRGPG